MIHLALTLAISLTAATHHLPLSVVVVLPPRIAAELHVGQVLRLTAMDVRFPPINPEVCLDGRCTTATPLEMEQIWLAYALARGEKPVVTYERPTLEEWYHVGERPDDIEQRERERP